ncbi:MAG: PKD domain-containing protein [Sandaracinaceae bacterium]|nr:PKD domain-containing protein [Sandaracinaceae bacterium]
MGLAAVGCECGAPATNVRRDGGGDVPDGGLMELDASAPAEEICNGLDDDGDGRVDENCGCGVGMVQSCYPGDPSLAGVGACALGSQTCADTGAEFGVWGACAGAEPPAGGEACDGIDNDCDGEVDEGCDCEIGETRPCYDGPPGTEDIGLCRAGSERCEAGEGGFGARWGACGGTRTPGTETCNGTDDDCNGAVDEGCGCTDGTSRPCYTGPAGTEGRGLCAGGTQYCTPDSMGGALWGDCVGATLPATDVCNGIDDDCDGRADQDCLCAPGSMRACWEGAAANRGVGACRDGVQTCELGAGGAGSDWGACTGQRLPGAEICDGIDNDCDAQLDEGCSCRPGETRACYSGPPGTSGNGTCRSGTQTCTTATDGTPAWGACAGEVLPGAEVCFDGADGDCDGVIDDGCVCSSGASRSCYIGPTDTRNIGVCRDGMQSCAVGGGGVGSDWGTCTGGRLPGAETCDGLDNDCDGTTDEGCSCVPGMVRNCYGGPTGTSGVGICRAGSQTCDLRPDGTADWSACSGATLPGTETCNGVDDDCDAMTDEGCLCDIGTSEPCYSGPSSTRGVGRCRDGSRSCVAGSGGSSWGACGGDTLPGTETCNGADDDCDGATDEGCSCTPRTVRSCYTGPAGTEGIGICRAGSQTCELSPDGTTSSWGACTGGVLPGGEACNGVDDDCDGVADDGCACVPGSTRACYDGPGGTRGLGLCRDGAQTCVSGGGGIGSSWGTCTGWTGPATETCNGADDDCDGIPDETCACTSGQTRNCYSGPPSTRGIGQCRDGTQSCVIASGMASWGACVGERLPASETCDMTDQDCDGLVDEGACSVPPTVTCPPPATTRPLTAVTLSGTASDPDGVIASYQWTLVSAPAGASGTFGSPSSATTSFTPNLVGVYTVRLTVTDNQGLTATCTTTVTARGDGIRIEVTWNTDFSDVDTHLLRMAGGTPWFNTPNDCYYLNTNPAWDAAGTPDDPRLDIDDVEGFGPENITLDVPVTNATYRVGIHYYDDDLAGASTVTVRIYCGDISVVPMATYTRTLNNGGGLPDANDFWRVADVRWLGGDSCAVTPINTLTTAGTARTTP